MTITNKELIQKAKNICNPKTTVPLGVETGFVGCALLTKNNNVYLGVNMDVFCGIGFCAEHSAIAAMVTNNESEIKKIVAYSTRRKLVPPCGRCRELMTQINEKNYNNTEVIIANNKSKKLKELLPDIWIKKKKNNL
jgi:cytidine deaminase